MFFFLQINNLTRFFSTDLYLFDSGIINILLTVSVFTLGFWNIRCLLGTICVVYSSCIWNVSLGKLWGGKILLTVSLALQLQLAHITPNTYYVTLKWVSSMFSYESPCNWMHSGYGYGCKNSGFMFFVAKVWHKVSQVLETKQFTNTTHLVDYLYMHCKCESFSISTTQFVQTVNTVLRVFFSPHHFNTSPISCLGERGLEEAAPLFNTSQHLFMQLGQSKQNVCAC